MPTAGAYAQPRPYTDQSRQVAAVWQRRNHAKRQLRVVQEQLDSEMANAREHGSVMSEGGYVAMMNAIKALWESVATDPEPGSVY